jgi:hypothetical protein
MKIYNVSLQDVGTLFFWGTQILESYIITQCMGFINDKHIRVALYCVFTI